MVKIQLANTTVTNCWSHMQDGWDNFQNAFTGLGSEIKQCIFRMKDVESYDKISLRGRIKLGFAGVGLMCPLINMIVYWALHKDGPHGVQFDKERIREFDKALPPVKVGEVVSQHIKI